MENRQPKTNQIPLVKMQVSQSESSECQIEQIQDESLDYLLVQLIYGGIPPFVVTEDYKQRREQQSPEPQSQAQCFNIQDKILSYNRKDKSLMELTRKFIDKFEGATSNILVLDQVTNELNVQRRRIYDIINIMESLAVVSKIKKNVYQWKGLIRAVETIQMFMRGENMQDPQKNKKQKSLQSLATLFLRLFTQSRSGLSLQEAAQSILSQVNQQVKKTKIRRLYDIVNVFKCLGLVEKVKSPRNLGGKPIYQWLGYNTLLKIIQERARKNNLNRIYHEDSGNYQSQARKQYSIFYKNQSNLNQTRITKNACNDNDQYQFGLKDISNSEPNSKRTHRNSEITQQKQNYGNPQLKKHSSLLQNRRSMKFQNYIPRAISPEVIKSQNKIIPTNLSISFQQLICIKQGSFFQNLITHMNRQGTNSLSDIQSRFKEIIWPS